MRINYDKLYEFDKDYIDESYVTHDLIKRYKVRNLDYEYGEAILVLAKALAFDYNSRIINYKAYIERYIDVRVMFELRKSALLKFHDEAEDRQFMKLHHECKTIEDIQKLRFDWIYKYLKWYKGYDWQFAVIVAKIWNISIDNVYFDFDECFMDGKPAEGNTKSYKEQFLEYQLETFCRLMPKTLGEYKGRDHLYGKLSER